jgi:hypothetical protein
MNMQLAKIVRVTNSQNIAAYIGYNFEIDLYLCISSNAATNFLINSKITISSQSNLETTVTLVMIK